MRTHCTYCTQLIPTSCVSKLYQTQRFKHPEVLSKAKRECGWTRRPYNQATNDTHCIRVNKHKWIWKRPNQIRRLSGVAVKSKQLLCDVVVGEPYKMERLSEIAIKSKQHMIEIDLKAKASHTVSSQQCTDELASAIHRTISTIQTCYQANKTCETHIKRSQLCRNQTCERLADLQKQ